MILDCLYFGNNLKLSSHLSRRTRLLRLEPHLSRIFTPAKSLLLDETRLLLMLLRLSTMIAAISLHYAAVLNARLGFLIWRGR